MDSAHDISNTRLLQWAQRFGRAHGVPLDAVLDPLGLILENPPHRWNYLCTPLNSLTFAHTGVDGEHFSLLSEPGTVAGVVVVTVPMSDHHNVIVGRDMVEFLRLGVEWGYGWLAQLAYGSGDVEYALAQADPIVDEQGRLVLAALKHEFGLTPIDNIATHLDALRRALSGYIVLADEEL